VPPTPGIALVVLGLAALLLSEGRGSQRGVWLAKPVASLGFVATALLPGVEGDYGRLVVAALVACVAGDVLLIPRDNPRAFQLGIAAFGLGLALYTAAFLQHAVDPPTLVAGAGALGLLGYAVWRWLAPHVPTELRAAVIGYIAIISLMVATAYAATRAGADPRIAIGATLFFLSDLSVARDAFVNRAFVNRAWGLPCYYAAQVVLASSVRG
jgi:uncharacterized membrane protein YhhN